MTQQFKHKTSGELYHIGKDQKQGTNLINSITGSEYFLPGYYEQKDVDELFTPVKETEPEQPYYKGKGEHSVNQLEAICSQYKEYVSFLNSRGNDTTPTSKEGLEDGGFTKGEWDIAENKETHHTEYAIKSNGWHIAKLNPYAPENIHAEANARLIAAAPAMYKALKEEIECLEEWNGNGNYTTRIEKIKAILTRINKD